MKKIILSFLLVSLTAASEYCGDGQTIVSKKEEGNHYVYTCSSGKIFKHIFGCLISCDEAQAKEVSNVTSEQAVRVILGAASDEGWNEMYAIARALRNRNNDHVQESKADISTVPDEAKFMAEAVWQSSAYGHDVVNGANFWVNDPINGNYIRSELKARWEIKKNFKIKIGRHRFYKVS